MNTLLGIALVVEDATKGQKLGFRYPGPAIAQGSENDSGNSISLNGENNNEGHISDEKSLNNIVVNGPAGKSNNAGVSHNEIDLSASQPEQNLDSSSNALGDHANKKNISEVSSNNSKSHALETNKTDGSERTKIVSVSNDVSHQESDEDQYEPSGFWKFKSETFARLFRPNPALCGKIFELVIDQLRFISHPVQISRNPDPELNKNAWSEGDITLFNVVFVLDASADTVLEESKHKLSEPAGPSKYGIPYSGCKAGYYMYREAAAKLAAALKYEEKRNGYVSREVKLMLAHHKSLANPNQVSAAEDKEISKANSVLPIEGLKTSDGEEKNNVEDSKKSLSWCEYEQARIDDILKRSNLARDLKKIFHSLCKYGCANISFQGTVSVSLSLQHPGIHPINPIRPYQTLLINDINLKDFAMDSSPQLLRMIKYLIQKGPMESFHDVSAAIGEPLVEIFRMAAHLSYWRKGKIIDTLSKNNIYRIAPTAPLIPTSSVYRKFDKVLSHIMEKNDKRRNALTLPRILSLFSLAGKTGLPMTLSDQMDTAKKNLNLEPFEFIEMVVFLLEEDMLIQLHQYVYLIVPTVVPRAAPKVLRAGDVHAVQFTKQRAGEEEVMLRAQSSSGGKASTAQSNAAEEEGDVQSQHMSQHVERNELAYLQRIANDSNVYRLLKRLRPYFHGKHHFEEIMWRNDISREALNTVIQTYSDVLIPFLR